MKKENEDQTPKQELTEQEQEQTAITPDKIYKNNIYALVDEVKEQDQFIGLTDEELKNNKAFFPTLIDYIYNNYIGDILGNKHGKQVLYNDIQMLDNIFNIYIKLVYQYKWNNRPLLVEFSLLTGINRDTFYNWVNGIDNNRHTKTASEYLTSERSDIVQKWIDTCERGLIDGNDTIKDIFILKAKYNYRDNNNVVEVNVNDLPALIGLKT